MALGQVIGWAKHFQEITQCQNRYAAGQVCFKLVQGRVCVRLRDTFARIARAPPDLEAKRLAEFIPEQFRNVQRFLHCNCVPRRRRGIGLLDVERAEKARVWVSRQESSPRLAANPRAISSAS